MFNVENISFITDKNNKKTSVIVPYDDFKSFLEYLDEKEFLNYMKEAENDESVDYDQFISEMKKEIEYAKQQKNNRQELL